MRIKTLLVMMAAPLALTAQTPAVPAAPVSALGTAAAPATIPVDRVVAIVGDQVILHSDILNSINQQRAGGLKLPSDSAGQAELAREALNALVDEEILVQKARELKIEITPDEVNRSVDDQLKRIRQQFQTDDEYKAELAGAGFGTPDEYRRTLYEQFYRRALQQRAFEDLRKTAVGRNVSEAEVTEAFEKNREVLGRQPATVTFRQVVISPKASVEARKRARAK
ncbi:MAG: SurA N-terminal domain-containing protein, partial [Gemmatimonadaceae bacterium]